MHFLSPFRFGGNAYNDKHTVAIRGQTVVAKYTDGLLYVLGGTETSGIGTDYFSLVTEIILSREGTQYVSRVYKI